MIGRFIKKVSHTIDNDDVEPTLLPYTKALSVVLTIIAALLLIGMLSAVGGLLHNNPVLEIGTVKTFLKTAEEDWWYLLADKIMPTVSNFVVFLFGTIMGVYGITYSLLSYKQAKKVELQIRGTISTYEAFIDQATQILASAMVAERGKRAEREIVLVLMFPYYGVLRDLEDVEHDMSGRLSELRNSSCKTKIILPDNPFTFGRQLFEEARRRGAQTMPDIHYDGLLADMQLLETHLSAMCPTQWRRFVRDSHDLRLGTKVEHMVDQIAQCSLAIGSYEVKRIPADALSSIYYQIVWTRAKAAIVFLPPREVFSEETTNAYGFYTEDKEMIRIIRMLANIAEESATRSERGRWFANANGSEAILDEVTSSTGRDVVSHQNGVGEEEMALERTSLSNAPAPCTSFPPG